MPPAVLDNEHVFHTLGGAGGLVANVRSQILANGLLALVTFCRGIRTAATRADGDLQEINQDAFRAAANRAGAALTVRLLFPSIDQALGFQLERHEVDKAFAQKCTLGDNLKRLARCWHAFPVDADDAG